MFRAHGWSGVDAQQALAALWPHLQRPFDPVEVAHALTGLPPAAGRQLAGLRVVTSDETDELLDRMPEIVRSLAVATTDTALRCEGEIRGPVLWSETIAARSASPGAGGVYICASPTKAYDTDENRVLLAALRGLFDAGRHADANLLEHVDGDQLHRARHNHGRALRFLEHRTMVSVTAVRPTPRAVQKARSGNRARIYGRAVAVLDRIQHALDPAALAPYCDRRTTAQHLVLAALADGLAARGTPLPPLRVDGSAITAGPISYLHLGRAGTEDALHGIVAGDLLIDVPDYFDPNDATQAAAALAARAMGRDVMLIETPRDIPRALEAVAARMTAA